MVIPCMRLSDWSPKSTSAVSDVCIRKPSFALNHSIMSVLVLSPPSAGATRASMLQMHRSSQSPDALMAL